MAAYCKACRYWEPHAEELDGECRMMPPTMAGVIAPHGDAQFQSPQRAIWPIVRCDDWCGEFSPASPEKGEG